MPSTFSRQLPRAVRISTGKRRPGGPPGAQHGEAVATGQAQIQDHRIVGLGVAQELGFLAVAGTVDGVAGQRQHLEQMLGDAGLVLGQQHAHRSVLALVGLVGLVSELGLGRSVEQMARRSRRWRSVPRSRRPNDHRAARARSRRSGPTPAPRPPSASLPATRFARARARYEHCPGFPRQRRPWRRMQPGRPGATMTGAASDHPWHSVRRKPTAYDAVSER